MKSDFAKDENGRPMFNTIDDVIAANQRAGYCFFRKGNMNFAGSRIGKTLYNHRYFVTSEFTNFDKVSRAYTVREVNERGDILTASVYLQYKTSAQANKAAKKLAYGE